MWVYYKAESGVACVPNSLFFALGQRYIKLVGTNSTKFRVKITVVYIVVTNIDCQYNDDFIT